MFDRPNSCNPLIAMLYLKNQSRIGAKILLEGLKMQQETKFIRGLRLFFAVCFCVVLLCVITVNYPLAGVILFLTGLLVIVSHVNVSRGGGQSLSAGSL